MDQPHLISLESRFRGFLPVVIDIETGGFDPRVNPILELAAVILAMDESGFMVIDAVHEVIVKPFAGCELNDAALKFNGINPHDEARDDLTEREALNQLFVPIRNAVKRAGCTRAVLVGHNPAFDLGFLNAAVERAGIKRNPFHPFSSFDTATLGGLAFGQTVLAKAVSAAGFEWDNAAAHSARYDAEQTAHLFCTIVNRWLELQRSAR
jgi:ribonuclease T